MQLCNDPYKELYHEPSQELYKHLQKKKLYKEPLRSLKQSLMTSCVRSFVCCLKLHSNSLISTQVSFKRSFASKFILTSLYGAMAEKSCIRSLKRSPTRAL